MHSDREDDNQAASSSLKQHGAHHRVDARPLCSDEPSPFFLVLGRWKSIAHLCEAMLMVLVHPHGALSPGLSRPLIQLLPRLLLSCLFCLLAASFPAANAQDPPAGLTVLASPAPNAYVVIDPDVIQLVALTESYANLQCSQGR